jgi:hypothetical protein
MSCNATDLRVTDVLKNRWCVGAHVTDRAARQLYKEQHLDRRGFELWGSCSPLETSEQ